MAFVEAGKSTRTGCALTLVLFGVLFAAFLLSRDVDVPTALRFETDRSRLSVSDCLESREARRLFGTIEKVPIGNPFMGRHLSRKEVLYSTAGGHLILVHEERNARILRVKGQKPITEAQVSFLRGCSDRLAMW